jgi:hypothetical protein
MIPIAFFAATKLHGLGLVDNLDISCFFSKVSIGVMIHGPGTVI